MTTPRIREFLTACTVLEDDALQDLSPMTMYGLYISWSLRQGETPATNRAFCDALTRHGIFHVNDDGLRTAAGLPENRGVGRIDDRG